MSKADQLASKRAKAAAKKEMETMEEVAQEERETFIHRQEIMKEKAKKKGKKIEDDDIASQKSKKDSEKPEDIRYAVGDMYDKEIADLEKVDYELE